MSVIQVLSAETFTDSDDLAPTRRGTPGEGGGVVPTGLAGYTYDGAAYCPECAESAETRPCAADGDTYTVARFPSGEHDESGFGVGVVSCTDEWDYPGASCDICHKRLDTNVLVYDSGGAHPEPAEWHADGVEHVPVFVVTVDGDDAYVLLQTDAPPYGEAGDTSWVPRWELDDYNDE